jgi:hypothetical protein
LVAPVSQPPVIIDIQVIFLAALSKCDGMMA